MIADSSDRTEKLLALILLNSLEHGSQRDKAAILNRAGFTNVEIADLLETSAQVISQHLYEGRKKRKLGKTRTRRR